MRCAAFLLFSLLLVGCAIAPSPTHTATITYFGNAQDAGLIRFLPDGEILVRVAYADNYHWLCSQYGSRLKPPVSQPIGLSKDGDYYKVTKEGAGIYARLVQLAKNNP